MWRGASFTREGLMMPFVINAFGHHHSLVRFLMKELLFFFFYLYQIMSKNLKPKNLMPPPCLTAKGLE